jgi:drug/metabolite transporter (DMT)-like permease
LKNIRDYGAILLAAVLWGCAALTVNLLGDSGASNQEILFVRAATSTVVMAIWIMLTDRKLFKIRLRDIWIFFGQGVLGYACTNLTYFTCIRTCSMGTAAALMYLAPAVVAVLSVPIFKEKLTLPKAISASLVLLGAACTAGVFHGGADYPVSGLLVGVLCGVVYGFYSIFGRISVGRYHVLTANFYSFGLATCFALPLIPRAELAVHLTQPRLMGAMVLAALLCTTAPYLLYTMALRNVPASAATVVSSLEPAVAALLGWALYNESLGADKIIGIGLIILAVTISTLKPKENTV